VTCRAHSTTETRNFRPDGPQALAEMIAKLSIRKRFTVA
jgi:hypothetical protein